MIRSATCEASASRNSSTTATTPTPTANTSSATNAARTVHGSTSIVANTSRYSSARFEPVSASPGDCAHVIERYDHATYRANAPSAIMPAREMRVAAPRAITIAVNSASTVSAPQYQVSSSKPPLWTAQTSIRATMIPPGISATACGFSRAGI